MSTMRVARLYGAGDVRVNVEPVPSPLAGETLVRVTAAGICGSDLHWFAEAGIGDARLQHPLVLGHEFAGIIEHSGVRVAVDPALPCGACEQCLTGNPNLCPTQHFAGHGADDGALRECVAWQTHNTFALPDSLSDEDGVMLEPLGVAIYAVELARLKPGMTVGVYGCGPIGLLIMQVARISGAAHVLATEKLAHRLTAAQHFGAKVFRAEGDEANAILAATQQRGVDVAIEIAGDNAAVETAIATTRFGGHVVLAGIPTEDRVAFTASPARRKGLTLALVRRMKHTYPRAIDLVARGLVDVRSLVTHRFPLTQVREAFATAARRDGLKVIVRP